MYETKNIYNIDFVQVRHLTRVDWRGGGGIVTTYEES